MSPVVCPPGGAARCACQCHCASCHHAELSGPRLGRGEEELEGTLDVLVEDHSRGSVVHHFLDTGRGRVRLLEALGGSDLKGAVTGQQVRARGRRSQDGGSLELKPGQRRRVQRDDRSARLHPIPSAMSASPVILVNFQDDPSMLVQLSWTDAANVTFGQVSDFYRANSYDQTWLTGRRLRLVHNCL